MRRTVFILSAVCCVVVVVALYASADAHPTATIAKSCGKERWEVKTLSDAAADEVSFRSKSTTVAALRKKAAPNVGQNSPRFDGAEKTTYKIKARLIEAKLEADSDIHLVVRDSSGTMIVELPDPGCVKSKTYRSKIRKGRNQFESACGTVGTSWRKLSGTATIKGVGFFDIKHGQTGVAPNGIELHPVIGFTASSC